VVRIEGAPVLLIKKTLDQMVGVMYLAKSFCLLLADVQGRVILT
jgi:hypothetical protein